MSRFSGSGVDAIAACSMSHGSSCTCQATSAFSAIHSDRTFSPAPKVNRVPLPTRRSSIPSLSAAECQAQRRTLRIASVVVSDPVPQTLAAWRFACADQGCIPAFGSPLGCSSCAVKRRAKNLNRSQPCFIRRRIWMRQSCTGFRSRYGQFSRPVLMRSKANAQNQGGSTSAVIGGLQSGRTGVCGLVLSEQNSSFKPRCAPFATQG